MAQQSSTTLSGHGAECVEIRYPDAPPEIVCFCDAATSFDIAVLSAVLDRPRGTRTSSGWCEACEDGLVSQCRRGGCY